jgi:ubiquinol-cytochrome c reductase cytochrome b subunit
MTPFVGAIVVPGLVMLSLFLMPIIGRWNLGHRFNVVWTFALLVGAGVLTALAWHHDHNGNTADSKKYLAAVADAETQAERAIVLAGSPTGIPPTGALSLMRGDPKTAGPKLFREHCASCHNHAPPSGSGTHDITQVFAAEKSSAANLWNFGSYEWIRGLLDADKIAGPHYFGNTKFKDGEMATSFLKETVGEQLQELKGEELAKYKQALDDVALALAVEGGNQTGQVADLEQRVEAGRAAIVDVFACTDCHKFHDHEGGGTAPDLTGYGSREWLTAFISNPAAERFYGENNDRMPAFAAHPGDKSNRLSDDDLIILVRWLRGDWYEPVAPNTLAE